MGLLDNKSLLITGVLTEGSIAYEVARVAQEQGAELALTGFGRGLNLTRRVAKKLPAPPDVLELDVNNPDHLSEVSGELGRRWGKLDGLLHSVAFAPSSCLGGDFLGAPWSDVSVALQTSAFSLKALAGALLPLMQEHGGSIVGLDFDASRTWPAYDWMGVAKAALEATARYLAVYLGPYQVRVNLVSAGPLATMAAKSIPGFDSIAGPWSTRAPLGWDTRNQTPAARACVALLSDWFPATTGEIVHVDGGFHVVGLAMPEA